MLPLIKGIVQRNGQRLSNDESVGHSLHSKGWVLPISIKLQIGVGARLLMVRQVEAAVRVAVRIAVANLFERTDAVAFGGKDADWFTWLVVFEVQAGRHCWHGVWLLPRAPVRSVSAHSRRSFPG